VEGVVREITVSEVDGLLAGHAEEPGAGTGCTVILAPEGAVAAAWTPGFAPGSRETESLKPECLAGVVHGAVLSGGSAFGLAAASGVARALRDRGIGFDAAGVKVPIVPAAVVYDYPGNLSKGTLPDEGTGRRAAEAASSLPLASGARGAGVSALAGRLAGPELASPSGIGCYGLELPSGLRLAAVAVVNPLGSVVDCRTGAVVSGVRRPDGTLASRREILELLAERDPPAPARAAGPPEATLIAAVATNSPLDRVGALRLARMAAAGMARSLYPAHLLFDGDTVFALATSGGPACGPSWLGALAADVLAEAILRSVPGRGA
jgi:L-aminopeptidase/D-esterase-like protein